MIMIWHSQSPCVHAAFAQTCATWESTESPMPPASIASHSPHPLWGKQQCLDMVFGKSGSIPRGHKQKKIRWHPREILSIRKLSYWQVWCYLQTVDRLDGCIVLWLLTTTMLCMVQWGLFHTTAQKPKVHLKAHPSFLFAKSRASLATVIKTRRHFLRLLVRKLLSLIHALPEEKTRSDGAAWSRFALEGWGPCWWRRSILKFLLCLTHTKGFPQT